MSEDLAGFLSNTPLFRTLTAEEVATVLPHLEVQIVEAEDPIFLEGDAGDAWYVVRYGEVVVRKTMPNGPEHDLAVLEAGECFGEMALIDDSPRLAAVYANTDAELVRFPRLAFQGIVADGGHVASKILLAMAAVLCERQRELTHILSDIVDDPGPVPQPARQALLALLRMPVAYG